jgi:hypothetical protein
VPSKPIIPVRAQRTLLEIARGALRVATGIASPLAVTESIGRGPALGLRAAVYVTLTEAGELRGCMGTLDPDRPIEETVALTAITAALQDPRFRPVAADEIELIRVDVSVLGPSVELEDASEFVPGVHGVMVERAGRRALLLPEVATDHGWDGARMLGAVCEKAGLPRDAWRDQKTRRLYFRTVRFGGSAVEGAALTA